MNPDQFSTPKKIINPSSSTLRFLNGNNSNNNMVIGTPNRTPNSITKKRSGGKGGGGSPFHLFPVMNKTSPLSFPKNPFESTLPERLHLPLVCSPSLFQQTNTPQHSSIEFKWTIDEISSLDPTNVEPHETQFQTTLDPDLEAKTQAAISSYFKEQQIVPSPVDCPLRHNQNIIFTEETGNMPTVKSGRRIRDGVAQTILTFPSNLPPEIEKLLINFSTYYDNQQQSPKGKEAYDASLRRTLFETSSNISDGCENESVVDSLIKYECDDDANSNNELLSPPKTPEVVTVPLLCAHNLRSSIDKRSFGSLSPISKLDSPFVKNNNKNQNNKNDYDEESDDNGLDDDDEDEDNINDKKFKYIKTNRGGFLPFSSTNYQDQIEKTIKTVPDDRSTPFIAHEALLPSSPTPLSSIEAKAPISADISIDMSFNSGNRIANRLKKSTASTTTTINNVGSNDDDDDDDYMQVSQLSTKSTSSSNLSIQYPDTPIRKRRSARRKNLSRSFSLHLSNDDDDYANNADDSKIVNATNNANIDYDNDKENCIHVKSLSQLKIKKILYNCAAAATTDNTEMIQKSLTSSSSGNLYRIDSGFNEMSTANEDELKATNFNSKQDGNNMMMVANKENDYSPDITMNDSITVCDEDVSMICCSTPSTR